MISINSDGENKTVYSIFKDDIPSVVDDTTLEKEFAEEVVDDEIVVEMIEHVLNQLKSDNICYNAEINGKLSLFFNKAYKKKLFKKNSDEIKTYANDIATKLEIQLMLDNAECAKEENVLKLYEDLLGDLPNDGTDDNGFNVVAVISENEDVNVIQSQNRFVQMIAWEKNRIKVENTDLKNAEAFKLPDIDLEKGYPSVLDALRIGGKYPRKQANNSEEVMDTEYITALNERIRNDEKILFATYCKICYDKTESMSKDKDGLYKPSFLNNVIQIIVITDKKIYLCKSLYEITFTEIDRENIKSTNFIYEKKHDSLGQIQFDLKDEYSLIITIDKAKNINGDGREIFDANTSMINMIFDEDIKREETESNYIDAIKHRFLNKVRAIQYLLGNEDEDIKISDINKYIIKTIVDNTSYIYEEIIEKPSNDVDKMAFMIQESVIDERLNNLIGEEVFIIDRNWGEMDDDVMEWVQDITEKTTELLDTIEGETRNHHEGVEENQKEKFEQKNTFNDDALYDELDQLIGLKNVKEKIRKFVEMEKCNAERKQNGKGVIVSGIDCLCFVGNKGAGKSSVAQIYGKLLFANGVAQTKNFVEVEDSDFDSKTEEDIKRVFDIIKMRSEGGIVLFCDIDHTINRNNSSMILGQLLAFIDNNRGNIRVIIAGKERTVLDFINSNDSFKSRFKAIVSFDDISLEHLMEIFISIITQNEFSIEPEALQLVESYLAKIMLEPDFANINTLFERFKHLVDIHIEGIKESSANKNLRVISVSDVKTLMSE